MADKYITVSGAGANTGVDWANAYQASQFQTMLDSLVAGDTGFVEEGTYTLTSTLDIDVNAGNSINPIYLKGVNSSHVDDGTRFLLDGNSAAVNGLNIRKGYWVITNFDIINATGSGINWPSAGGFSTAFNYEISNCGGDGVTLGTSFTTISGAKIHNNADTGVDSSNICSINNCLIYNNSNRGVFNTANSPVMNCIIHNNTSSGIFNAYWVNNCIIDGNGIGIDVATSIGGFFFENNRITNNTTGIDTSGATVNGRNNFFYNNTTKIGGTGVYINHNSDDIDGVADGYTNLAGDDFTLTVGASGVGVSIGIGVVDEAKNIFGITQGIPPMYTTPITVTNIAPAEGGVGSSVTITGANFSASGNIVKFGGSGGTVVTITSENSTEIQLTVPSLALAVYDIYIENADGVNILLPNAFEISNETTPIFSGLETFNILSDRKIFIDWSAATGTVSAFNFYLRDAAGVFNTLYLTAKILPGFTKLYIELDGVVNQYLTPGVTYYAGLKAENNGLEDSNTVELSAIVPSSDYETPPSDIGIYYSHIKSQVVYSE